MAKKRIPPEQWAEWAEGRRRMEEALRRFEARTAELKERVHVLPANLADKDEVEALVPKAEQIMGQLDILVANAGITRDNLLVQLRDEDWEQVININLTATFRLARAATRGMMRRRFGRIIGNTPTIRQIYRIIEQDLEHLRLQLPPFDAGR